MPRFTYRAYKRAFRELTRLGQGAPARHREGLLIRLEEDGVCGFGEVAPLPSFGTETREEAMAWCMTLGSEIDTETIERVPPNLPCTRFALESALRMLSNPIKPVRDKLDVCALLSPGYACLKEVPALLEAGYRTFKWKVGPEPVKELTIFRQLQDLLPEDARLRVDANASLDVEKTKRWLKLFEESPIDFFEQPMPTDSIGALGELASYFSTRVALDEAVSTLPRLVRATRDGWEGPLVVKPALLGKLNEFLKWREKSPHELIYSSAYETGIGFQTVALVAASDPRNEGPAGFGTLDAFATDDGMGLHHPASTLGLWQFAQSDFERLWDACRA